jgi:hypothetical protein
VGGPCAGTISALVLMANRQLRSQGWHIVSERGPGAKYRLEPFPQAPMSRTAPRKPSEKAADAMNCGSGGPGLTDRVGVDVQAGKPDVRKMKIAPNGIKKAFRRGVRFARRGNAYRRGFADGLDRAAAEIKPIISRALRKAVDAAHEHGREAGRAEAREMCVKAYAAGRAEAASAFTLRH